MKKKLSAKLLEVRREKYSEQNQQMISAKLDVKSVLTEAKRVYREVLEAGKWPAAAHATDSKGIKHGYGNQVNYAEAINAIKQMI